MIVLSCLLPTLLHNFTSFVYCFSRKSGKDNPLKCTYVLPDGVTHTKGYVKDVDEAQRFLNLQNGNSIMALEGKKTADGQDDSERTEERRKINLNKNVVQNLISEEVVKFEANFAIYVLVPCRSLT